MSSEDQGSTRAAATVSGNALSGRLRFETDGEVPPEPVSNVCGSAGALALPFCTRRPVLNSPARFDRRMVTYAYRIF